MFEMRGRLVIIIELLEPFLLWCTCIVAIEEWTVHTENVAYGTYSVQ